MVGQLEVTELPLNAIYFCGLDFEKKKDIVLPVKHTLGAHRINGSLRVKNTLPHHFQPQG